MRRERLLACTQLVVGMVLVLAVSLWWPGSLPVRNPILSQLPTAIAFAFSLVVLGLFNVWLPRGDAVDTTGPIVFSAAAMLHPLLAVAVMMTSRCVVVVARPRGQTTGATLEYCGRRTVLVALTFSAFGHGFLGDVQSGQVGLSPLDAAAAAIVFMLLDMFIEQLHASVRSHAPFLPLLVGTVQLQGPMVAAEMSVAVLAVLLFPTIGYWGLLVTVGLLLVMRQSFALLLEVRASYTSTVEVLARAIEAYDPDRRGHAERVARSVGEAGRMFGLHGKRLEDLTYAALFHDVGMLGMDNAEDSLEHRSSEILSNVGFLSGAVPVLRIVDTAAEGTASLDEKDLVGAYFVASFSALDGELMNGQRRSYELTDAIGARLYVSTRRRADRVIRLVEKHNRENGLTPATNVGVIA